MSKAVIKNAAKVTTPLVFGPHLHNPAQMAKFDILHTPQREPQTFRDRCNERIRQIIEGKATLSDTGRVRIPQLKYGPWETGSLSQNYRRLNRKWAFIFFILFVLDRLYANYTDFCDAVFYALSNNEIQRHRAPFLSYLLSRLPGYGDEANIYKIVERVNRLQAKEFIRSVRMVPYGALGTQLNEGSKEMLTVARPPDHSTLTVDAIPLQALVDDDFLPGAAQDLRHWLRSMSGNATHEVDFVFVDAAKARIGDCFLKTYGENTIAHCIVPDFREGLWTKSGAIDTLSMCYANILELFASQTNCCDRLRLPILSAGLLAGPELIEDFPNITIEALIRAFTQLKTAEQETLLMRIKKQHDKDGNQLLLRNDKCVDLCIFAEREWQWYNNSRDTLSERIY